MKLLRKISVIVFIIILILVLVYVLWFAFTNTLSWITKQESQIATAIIAFAGSVVAVIISQQRSKSREIAEAHRPKKIKLYIGFITTMVKMLRKHKGSAPAALEGDKEIEDFFYQFTSEVVLWGSSDVLYHYARFRNPDRIGNPNTILIMDDIMQAMRKDLGLSNWGLSRGDLMKMFLTDPEALDELIVGSNLK